MDSANRFNQILVVDSIPNCELNTARRLAEDIATYAHAYPETSPAITTVRVESGYEFLDALEQATGRAVNEDVIPALHIECHGCEHGLQFADDSILDWPEIKGPLTMLNVATKMNLMVVVAACSGAAIAKTVSLSDRAPFWGMIGPTDSLFPSDLETGFRALYTSLLEAGSAEASIRAFEAVTKPGQFWRTTAVGIFQRAWDGYKSSYCSDEVILARAQRMVEECRRRGRWPVPTVNQMRDRLIEHEPLAFHRFRKIFFMEDLFPDQAGRFPVSPNSNPDDK